MKKNISTKMFKMGLIFAAAFMLAQPSMAFQTIGETAELLPEGFYKLGLSPQLIVSDGGGFNMGAFYDMYLIDSLNGRIELGGGKTDFWATASVKWVPLPDIDRQPAVGLRTAVTMARDEDANFFNVQLAPIISKKADTRYGEMIPFVALPVTFVSANKDLNSNGKTYTTTQFAIGAEWFQDKDVNYGAEFDLNMSNSYSSISAFVSFPFDGRIGYKRK